MAVIEPGHQRTSYADTGCRLHPACLSLAAAGLMLLGVALLVGMMVWSVLEDLWRHWRK